jgi:adenylate kinase family enzyme
MSRSKGGIGLAKMKASGSGKAMKRIVVIGCSGSGKSTFSRKLQQVTGNPLHHLDKLFWLPDWELRSDVEQDRIQKERIKEDNWIIDGNYQRSLPIRLERADTVFFFDYPRRLCLYRALKRIVSNRKRTRPDMGEGCPERFDWEFMKFIWNFNKNNRPGLIALLDQAPDGTKVQHFRRPREAADYLRALEKQKEEVA